MVSLDPLDMLHPIEDEDQTTKVEATTETKTDSPPNNLAPNGSSSRKPNTITKAYPHLLSFDELPEWHKDNQYIREGYRPISGSAAVSFRSLLYLHNETINIYTHLIPAIAFIICEGAVLGHLHTTYYPAVKALDDLIFTAFILTAILCLSFSACYHTLTNHSVAVDNLWLRLDFVGIILLTVGDFVSGIYMVFWCERVLRIIYWSMILGLGVLDIGMLVGPKFQGRSWRRFRVMCFVGTGLSGFAPLAHGIYLFGWSQMMKQSGMPYYLAEGGC
ncbi:hemolysin-III related-domain-containing protein [Bombardia bombarda]|uniref:Hemolysin-III related-domain-containing protein n=1 Tax=Bombardia bombarda TaxID=252184 RepID=A0AA39W9I0_9PEZI|nr:hemolysin-III related-domain-containing protein [Bombardia bombarda]